MAAPEPAALKHWRLLVPVLACILVVAFLALQVLLQWPLAQMDQEITQYFATQRQPWLTRFTLAIADAHETVKLLGITVLLALWRTWRRDLRSVRLLAVVPAGMLLNVALKNVFQRPRPVWDEPLVQLSTYSFPSGHAVASTVFYGAVCALVFTHVRSPMLRGLTALAGILMVLLVTFSRVYLGAHFLTDVIAGVAVGLLCLLLFGRAPAQGLQPSSSG
jgi:membrane-associated phospholipid phosphatase